MTDPAMPDALKPSASPRAPEPAATNPAATTPVAASPEPVPVMDDQPRTVDPGDARLFGVIDRLAAILDHSDLVELEIQVGQTGLTLRKPAAIAAPVTAPAATPGAGAAAESAPASAATAASAADSTPPARPSVKAPLTGIWYGSPAPGSAPYVQVGSEIAVGTVIGLIEAMKLFNEIKSDQAGRVVKMNAESGKLVKAKQPLLEIEPL
jgi:acetyl-CoA carboxylase biotin carboxyl carrier protein